MHQRNISSERRRAVPVYLSAALTIVCAFGQVQDIRFLEATATQAVISFTVPDPTNCLVQVSTDPNFATLVNDTNAVLFPGSQNCNRASSAVWGEHVTFVAGTRTSAQASDGLFYSLALEANRLHYFRIISQGVDFASCDPNFNCIHTRNPPFGNTFPEPAPFNAAAPFNYAWPTIRPGIDRNRWVNDPSTGIPVSMLSAPVPVNNNGAVTTNAPGVKGFDAANNGNWSNVNNAAVIDNGVATNAGANQDPVFVRLTPWCVGGATLSPPGTAMACPQGQSTWTEPGIDQVHFNTIDDIQVQLVLSGTGSTTQAQFALTVDGVNPATDWQTASITGSLTTILFPPTGTSAGGVITNPGFPATQFGTGTNATPFGFWFANPVSDRLTRPDLQAHTGTVSVDGSGNVTWQTGEKFRMSSVSVGSILTLVVGGVNTDFRITAVTSPFAVAIASPPAAGTYNYLYQQFGVLVRKAGATTGNLNVDGAKYSDFESAMNQMPISGLVDICATYTVTDSSGAVLRPCSVQQGFYHPIYVIDEVTGASRFLGLTESNGGCFTGNCAAGVSNHANDFLQPISGAFGSMFTQTPGHWSLNATDTTPTTVLIDAAYNPAGPGSCPNDWQEITVVNCPTYPYNNNVTFTNVTPKVGADGADHTPITQATNYNQAQRLLNPAVAIFDPTRFTTFTGGVPVDQTMGWVEVEFSTNSQNFMSWAAKFDPAHSYNVVAMFNSYSSYNCRFCGDHGDGSLGGYEGIAATALPACTGLGCGEFDLQTITNTDNVTQNTCFGITDPNFASFNGQPRCFDLVLSGTDPCHTRQAQTRSRQCTGRVHGMAPLRTSREST